MSDYYVLRGHEVVGIDDVHEWGRMFNDTEARVVGNDTVGEATVSTVFLGIDHNFGREGAPLLFETMIFGGPHNEFQIRYGTWDEAAAGHSHILEAVTNGTDPWADR